MTGSPNSPVLRHSPLHHPLSRWAQGKTAMQESVFYAVFLELGIDI